MVSKQSHAYMNHWANVVLAMLAVNKYPIDKAARLFDQLEANGLFDPRNLASWSHAEIFDKLKKSGYNRADLVVGFLAERVQSLGILAADFQENEKILASGSKQEITVLMSKVKGIGPVVLNNFFLLRGK